MSKPTAEAATVSVRIAPSTRDELMKIQNEFWAEHGAPITIDQAIRRLLADRKPIQP